MLDGRGSAPVPSPALLGLLPPSAGLDSSRGRRPSCHRSRQLSTSSQLPVWRRLHGWGLRSSSPACGPAAHGMGCCTHPPPHGLLSGVLATSSLWSPRLTVAASPALSGYFLSVSQCLSPPFVHLVAQLENPSPLSPSRTIPHSSESLTHLTSKMKGHARVAGPALRRSVLLRLRAAVTASPHTSFSGWGAAGSPPPWQTPLCTPPHRSTAQCSQRGAAQ